MKGNRGTYPSSRTSNSGTSELLEVGLFCKTSPRLHQVSFISTANYTCAKGVVSISQLQIKVVSVDYLFSAFRSIAENICLKRFDRKQMANEALK